MLLVPHQADVRRSPDRGRVAANELALTLQDIDLVREDPGRGAERRVPAIREPRRERERPLLTHPAQPDGDAGLHRPDPQARIPQLEVRALERDAFLVEQAREALHSLGHRVEAVAQRWERDAVHQVLGLRPAGAERRLRPSARQVVDGGDRVREDRRVAVAHRVDQDADPDARGRHRQRRVGRDGLVGACLAVAQDRVEVVPGGDPIEPERLDRSPVGEHLVNRGPLRPGVHSVGGHVARLPPGTHRRRPSGRVYAGRRRGRRVMEAGGDPSR